MQQAWRELIDRVLAPTGTEPVQWRALHHEAERAFADRRARALADCVRRIGVARDEVFAAGDGVVGPEMTNLERTWRTLARPDVDAPMM